MWTKSKGNVYRPGEHPYNNLGRKNNQKGFLGFNQMLGFFFVLKHRKFLGYERLTALGDGKVEENVRKGYKYVNRFLKETKGSSKLLA